MTQRASIQKRGLVLPASVLLAAGLVLAILAMLGNGVPHAAAAPVAPSAATWYVNAATGSDGFTCQSPAAPCLTVGAAVTKAADGDAIVVAAGVYVEHLDVSKALTITGAGPALTFLDGGGSGRVLQTSGSTPKTLADLTIQHGRLTGSNDNGAAIRNLGTLRLQNVTVYSNTTNASGAIYNGGGRLTLENSRLLSNTVVGAGGAIYMYYNGHVTVTHSLLAGNRASQGGAIYSLANLYVADSTLRDNTAETFGGGLIVFGGTAVLERSTFTGNHADGNGGGIHNNLGVLTMTNTTLSRNSANNYPALSNVSANAHTWIRSSTIADNVATSAGTGYGLASFNGAFLTVQGTLFAANADQNCLVSGTWTSAGHNLSSDNSCGLTAPGDLPLVDPLLAPLADYGGAAWTHALLPGSPAIDAGDNAACPAVDQRGVPRPFDGDGDGTAVCDIGAFEARSQLLVSDVTLAEGSAGTTQAVFTVTLAPTSTQPVTVAFATADDTAVAGSDYTAAAGVLTFSPGEALKQVPVDVLGDTEDEADETFRLNLGPAGGADVID
ncbi:MAG: right-handed parallel beta-helix repeat-containing protein, partial [Anaerolineales bacterium]|nr:right-handed parallel beta-helix repeat-containing protein [Anaerolineales bacterium]